jgi:hypothetical protein
MAEASYPKYDRKTSGISANRRVLLVRLPEKKLRSPPKTETPLAALTASALSIVIDDAGSVRWSVREIICLSPAGQLAVFSRRSEADWR